MAIKVVDASALAALLFGEPEAEAVAARLEIEAVAVDHVGVIELASKARLTAYDASYLWLAQRLGAELVTLDKELGQAAIYSNAP